MSELLKSIPRQAKIAAVVVVLIAGFWGVSKFSSAGLGGDVDLPLQVYSQNNMITIQNRGDRPITINGVGINNLAECTPKQLTDQLIGNPVGNFPQKPQMLRTGEKGVWITSCNTVKATISTDQGSEVFTFE